VAEGLALGVKTGRINEGGLEEEGEGRLLGALVGELYAEGRSVGLLEGVAVGLALGAELGASLGRFDPTNISFDGPVKIRS
jgi:hypothetical protein